MNTINPANLTLSTEQWQALMPYIGVGVGSMLILLLGTVTFTNLKKFPVFIFSILTLLFSIAWTFYHWPIEGLSLFNGFIRIDYFSAFFNVLFASIGILVLLGSYSYLDREEIHYSEFYPIFLLSILGMMFLAAATELISLFIALELMSLAVYVLVGIRRRESLANEASIKYFIMGGISAAVYLYGVAMLYGVFNTTRLPDMMMILQKEGAMILSNPIFIFGLILVLIGFFFKVGMVPFHMWTPDVYEGAPAMVTSFMSTALKAAVFATFVRIYISFAGDLGVMNLQHLQPLIYKIVWWLSLGTMIFGNIVALVQSNLKRLLAYSAIAHSGYLMVGILVGPKVGYSAVLLYLVVYSLMNIGAWSILAMMSGKLDARSNREDFAGIASKHPFLAAAMTVFLLSLAGLPPTGGFVGKYFLFSSALEAGEVLLVLIAIFASLASVYYYLRVVISMYMEEAHSASRMSSVPKLAVLAIAICLILTLHLGIFPAKLLSVVKQATIFNANPITTQSSR